MALTFIRCNNTRGYLYLPFFSLSLSLSPPTSLYALLCSSFRSARRSGHGSWMFCVQVVLSKVAKHSKHDSRVEGRRSTIFYRIKKIPSTLRIGNITCDLFNRTFDQRRHSSSLSRLISPLRYAL